MNPLPYTAILRSTITAEEDRHLGDCLSTITDLPVDGFGKEIVGRCDETLKELRRRQERPETFRESC